MKVPNISLIEWQNNYVSKKACTKILEKFRWPQGFQCSQYWQHQESR